jgi:hypothetical protein
MTTLASQATTVDIETITFYPGRSANSASWRSPLDFLTHLLFQPEDRDCIRNEASRISPYQSRCFFVLHALLGRRLVVTSFDTDRQFARTIQSLLMVIEEERGLCRISPPYIIWHTQYILIRDPLKLVNNPVGLARALHPSYDRPMEILVLEDGYRVTPLIL